MMGISFPVVSSVSILKIEVKPVVVLHYLTRGFSPSVMFSGEEAW